MTVAQNPSSTFLIFVNIFVQVLAVTLVGVRPKTPVFGERLRPASC